MSFPLSSIIMDGILNLNKPRGRTSFDMVRRVRTLSGQGRVGHAGTLDRPARGVLLMCLGRATKIVRYLLGEDKEYLATIRLGESTDTDDATGRILSSARVPKVGRGRMEELCRSFLGEIEQIPPIFSALKVNGERLHRIARRGGRVTPKSRKVEIKELEILDFTPPLLEIRTLCSKGTYIRSLARDIGAGLGCGAHLSSLTRTRLGDFKIEDSVCIDGLDGVNDIESYLLPIASGLARYPKLVLGDAALARVRSGRGFPRDGMDDAAERAEGELLVLQDRAGRVIALAKVEGILVKPFRVLG